MSNISKYYPNQTVKIVDMNEKQSYSKNWQKMNPKFQPVQSGLHCSEWRGELGEPPYPN